MASRIPPTRRPQKARRISTQAPGSMASKVSQPPFIALPISRRVQVALGTSTEGPLIKRTGTIQRSKSDSEVIMKNRIPPSASTSSQTARRRSTEYRNSLLSAEMLSGLTELSPPKQTADDSRQNKMLQKCRAVTLTALLRQYNIARKGRDNDLRNGTYDPNTESSRIDANNSRRAILLIRRLYRQIFDSSKRNNTERSDRTLIENIMARGNIANHDALYLRRRASSSTDSELRNEISISDTEGSSSTEFEGSHAEQTPHTRRESNMNPTGDMRNAHAQQNNDLCDCVNQSSQNNGGRPHCLTPQQLSDLDVLAKRIRSQFWDSAEALVRNYESVTEFCKRQSPPTINESRPRNIDTDLESYLETSVVNHRKRSETIHVNPVNQNHDTSTQSGSNSLKNNGPITNRKTPAAQAEPSRLRQKNPVAPILDTSSQDEGNSPKNNASIKRLKRSAQQTRPSWIRQENPVALIHDSYSKEEDNGSFRDRKRSTQQAGPSYNRDKDLAAQNNVLRNYQRASDLDMVPIGNGNAMVPQRVLDNIDWKVHTTATRQLLQAIFPRSVLATHSLTGKPSPAFVNCPAKKILDPKLVDDIVTTVSKKCEVRRNLVRSCITTKCNDEAKLCRNRQKSKEKRKRQKENKPPSSSSDF